MTDVDTRLRDLGAALVDQVPARPEELGSRARRVRRHRRVRQAVAGLALAAVLGGVVVVTRGDEPVVRVETPPAAAGSDAATVLAVDGGTEERVTLYDLDAGTRRDVALPGRVPGDFASTLVATGGWLVYHASDGVRAVRADGTGRPVVLAEPSWSLRPSARPGWIWLVRPSGWGGGAFETVREVRVEGAASRVAHDLPRDASVLAGVPGGLLVSTGRDLARWDARSRSLTPALTDGGSSFVDARADRVAYASSCGDGGCEMLAVVDLPTGVGRRIGAPAGASGWLSTAGQGSRDAFSRDGRYLALRASGPDGTQVHVVDLRTGATTPVPDSIATYPYSRTAWSPRGHWLYHETAAGTVGAYRPSDGATRTYPVECCGVALVSLPRAWTRG